MSLSDTQVKEAYERNLDTNAFTDFDKDKLDRAIAEWNTNVEYSLNEDVTFEGDLYRFKEDFSAVIYEVSVNEFAIRNVNGIDQFVSVFEGGVKVVNSVLISGNDVTKNDDGSYTVQGSLKSYHSDPVLQDTTNETGSIIVSKTDHYGVVIQIHSTGENPTIDTAHWEAVTGGFIHGTFITDAERAKLAGIETGATTDQDLSSYTGAWVAVRQYLNNEQVSFEGKLYDNTEILIRQTYEVGVNEMEVQADNGIDDFIIINDEDNGSSLVIVNVNDARVLSGTNGGNYVVLIGHRKYTSIGVSQATGDLSATRTLANFEMRVDDVALAGESPIDKPLNWLQISLTEAELNAKLIAALGPYLTTVDHLSDGITEFNNLIAYGVGDIVYYKDPTNTSEEQIFYEVLLSSGAAGVDANGDPRTPLNDIGGPDGLNRFFRIVASALQGTKADDALNILDIKLDGDTTTTLSDATITGSSSISFTSDEGVTKVFTVPAVVSANDSVITIEQNGNVIGDFTTNQAANKTIKLLNTTTTVINETTITNAVDYVLNTFYADETQVKFEDHYYEKYGEPELYLGVWASIDPYLPTRIVSHNGFYYVASGNGATPGQEPNTGATDGDGEQAWVLIDINPVAYSGVWKPLVASHFTITANEGGTGDILSTLDINGTNYVIPDRATATEIKIGSDGVVEADQTFATGEYIYSNFAGAPYTALDIELTIERTSGGNNFNRLELDGFTGGQLVIDNANVTSLDFTNDFDTPPASADIAGSLLRLTCSDTALNNTAKILEWQTLLEGDDNFGVRMVNVVGDSFRLISKTEGTNLSGITIGPNNQFVASLADVLVAIPDILVLYARIGADVTTEESTLRPSQDPTNWKNLSETPSSGTTLPDQAGNAGEYLVTNGTVLAWQALGTGTPNPRLSTFDLFFGTAGAGGIDGGVGTETFELYTHGVFGAYFWFPNRSSGNGEWANAKLNADQTIKFDLAGNDI